MHSVSTIGDTVACRCSMSSCPLQEGPPPPVHRLGTAVVSFGVVVLVVLYRLVVLPALLSEVLQFQPSWLVNGTLKATTTRESLVLVFSDADGGGGGGGKEFFRSATKDVL